jgi:hypothetical protein
MAWLEERMPAQSGIQGESCQGLGIIWRRRYPNTNIQLLTPLPALQLDAFSTRNCKIYRFDYNRFLNNRVHGLVV